jgi:hypothetical protein
VAAAMVRRMFLGAWQIQVSHFQAAVVVQVLHIQKFLPAHLVFLAAVVLV